MKLIWVLILLMSAKLHASDIFKELPDLAALDTHQRISYWANRFTGLPYAKGGPLGEGQSGKFDRDPLYRFDTFDCTTFVETVTALSKSENKNQFEDKLLELRYKNSQVSYQTRNHITSQSWIPENTANGHFTEETLNFPSQLVDTAQTVIDLPAWYHAHKKSRLRLPGLSNRKLKKKTKELQSLGAQFQSERVELPYLVIDELLNNWELFEKSLKGVYVINIVRPNWNMKYKVGTDLLVSHQGFLLVKNGVPTMIHASTSGEVVQISLKKYLGWFKNSSTVEGINLLQVNL